MLRKTIFIAEQRSGSTLLSELLCMNDPAIYPPAHNHIKVDEVEFNLDIEAVSEWNIFIETLFLSYHRPNVRHVFEEQHGQDMIAFLIENGFKFVYLSRKNKIRQAMSLVQSLNSNKWHVSEYEDYQEPKIHLPQPQLDKMIVYLTHTAQLAEEMFEYYGIAPLRIFYEDNLIKRYKREHLRYLLESYLAGNYDETKGMPWNPKPRYRKIADINADTAYRDFMHTRRPIPRKTRKELL